MSKSGSRDWLPLPLCLQKRNVFINGCAAHIADPCKLADIQTAGFVGRIVAVKGGGDFLLGDLRAADRPPF